jgi:integrase/recombinase XerD
LFGICLYTTARINEACLLNTADVYGTDGRVRGAKQFPLWGNRITFRRNTTKGKQETRSVPVSPELRQLLEGYRSDPERISFAARPYLFPGRWWRRHICPESADAILRAAFKQLGIEGASTQSFRRKAITWMHNERVPIKHIQSISGHKSLSALQRYIDVTEKDKEMAIAPSQGQLIKELLFSCELSVLKQTCTVKHNFLYCKSANNYLDTVCDSL